MSENLSSSSRTVAYLFPGQGSQFNGMGKDLYDTFPEARKVYDDAARLLDFDLLSICFNPSEERLSQTRFCQPAIFVTSMAAFEVFKNHSKAGQFLPKYAAGLSMGEATALCATGALSFVDGVRFVKDRGLFMDNASQEKPGLMAAVMGLDLASVEAVCGACGAEVGNLNGPGQIVISGYKKNVEEAIERLKSAGARKVIPLPVSGGFHSRCMDSACEHIGKALEGVLIRQPMIPVVSNLTARVEAQTEEIRLNLKKQMNHRTLWEASMRFIIENGVRTFIEFAPGKVLKGLLKKIDPGTELISLGTAEDFHAIS